MAVVANTTAVADITAVMDMDTVMDMGTVMRMGIIVGMACAWARTLVEWSLVRLWRRLMLAVDLHWICLDLRLLTSGRWSVGFGRRSLSAYPLPPGSAPNRPN